MAFRPSFVGVKGARRPNGARECERTGRRCGDPLPRQLREARGGVGTTFPKEWGGGRQTRGRKLSFFRSPCSKSTTLVNAPATPPQNNDNRCHYRRRNGKREITRRENKSIVIALIAAHIWVGKKNLSTF